MQGLQTRWECLNAASTAVLSFCWKSIVTRQHCVVPYFILGGYICMTTRSNQDNLEYKASLEHELKQMEQEGLWICMEVTEVEDWERAVSEKEHGYISGAVYLYKKTEHSIWWCSYYLAPAKNKRCSRGPETAIEGPNPDFSFANALISHTILHFLQLYLCGWCMLKLCAEGLNEEKPDTALSPWSVTLEKHQKVAVQVQIIFI